MEIKVIRKPGNRYIVNNLLIDATNFKEALAKYVSQTMAGSQIQLSKG